MGLTCIITSEMSHDVLPRFNNFCTFLYFLLTFHVNKDQVNTVITNIASVGPSVDEPIPKCRSPQGTDNVSNVLTRLYIGAIGMCIARER